jgi:hypothetical protein
MLLHRDARGSVLLEDELGVLLVDGRATAGELSSLGAAVRDALGLRALAEARARAELRRQLRRLTPVIALGRAPVVREFARAEGDRPCARLVGARVVVDAGDARFDGALLDWLDRPRDPALTDALGEDLIARIDANVRALAAHPCACGTDPRTPEEHGTIAVITKEPLGEGARAREVTVGRCTFCGRGWTFERDGDRVLSSWPFSQDPALCEDESSAVVAALHDGYRVMVGGTRAHTTYFAQDGQLRAEHFDEGFTDEISVSEDAMREDQRADPRAFRDALGAQARRALVAALRAGDRPLARARLYACARREGCPWILLDALLAWPEVAPDAASREAIARALAATDALVTALRRVFDFKPTSADLRILEGWLDALGALLGASPDLARVRQTLLSEVLPSS